jgi:hypothetical protein
MFLPPLAQNHQKLQPLRSPAPASFTQGQRGTIYILLPPLEAPLQPPAVGHRPIARERSPW